MKVIRKKGKGAYFLEKALKGLSNVDGKVGWFKSAKYEDGTAVALIAAIQEFGYPEKNIPARPTLRPMIREKRELWRRVMRSEARKILKGEQTSKGAMEVLTLIAAGNWRQAITQLNSPALSPRTVAARKARYARKGVSKKAAKVLKKYPVMGIDKPLVDQGYLLTTLTSVVVPK